MKNFILSISMIVTMTTVVNATQSAPSILAKALSPTDAKSEERGTTKANNAHIIDEKTLVSWVNDWEYNKPKDVKGKLIILQIGDVDIEDEVHSFIKHDDVHVFTFDESEGFSKVSPITMHNHKNSGMPKTVLGENVVEWGMRAYDIDSEHDMVLLVKGEDKKVKKSQKKEYPSNSISAARAVCSMKYWGFKHFAVLNGNLKQKFDIDKNRALKALGIYSLDDIFVAEASIPPMNGTHRLQH
jgi:hypothetical protein